MDDTRRFYILQKGTESKAIGVTLTDNEYAAVEIMIDDFNEFHSNSEEDYFYLTEINKDDLTRDIPQDETLRNAPIFYHGIIYYWSASSLYFTYLMARPLRNFEIKGEEDDEKEIQNKT